MVIPETHCNYTYAIPNALEQKIHESFVKTKILLLFPPFNINSLKKTTHCLLFMLPYCLHYESSAQRDAL